MTDERVQGVLCCLLMGYLIGSLSPSFLIGRLKGYDVRSSGSGNAGATNTFLLAGKLAGALVALIDILKAALSWRLAQALFPALPLAGELSGTACVLGHVYPVFLRFRGGKGLACIGGVILAYDPRGFLMMLGLALLLALVTRYIAVVTVSVCALWPVLYGLSTGVWLGAAVLSLPVIPVLLQHMANFRRIREGKELRVCYLWDSRSELERTGYTDQT